MLKYRTNVNGSAVTNMELLEAEQKFRETNANLSNFIIYPREYNYTKLPNKQHQISRGTYEKIILVFDMYSYEKYHNIQHSSTPTNFLSKLIFHNTNPSHIDLFYKKGINP